METTAGLFPERGGLGTNQAGALDGYLFDQTKLEWCAADAASLVGSDNQSVRGTGEQMILGGGGPGVVEKTEAKVWDAVGLAKVGFYLSFAALFIALTWCTLDLRLFAIRELRIQIR